MRVRRALPGPERLDGLAVRLWAPVDRALEVAGDAEARVTGKTVLRQVDEELRTCIALLEASTRPNDHERGQLEALRHMRVFLAHLYPSRRSPRVRR